MITFVFVIFLSQSNSSFEDSLFRSHALLFEWVFFPFFTFCLLISSSVLDIYLLIDVYLEMIISSSVVFSFTHFIVSLAVQNDL